MAEVYIYIYIYIYIQTGMKPKIFSAILRR